MSVKQVEVVVKSWKNALPLPLQSCDSWMFVKENPDGKKNYSERWTISALWASASQFGNWASAFRNLATKRWIVLPLGTLFLPKSFLYCRCVRRTDFASKYASMIFIHSCVAYRPLGSILVSKESPRPTVYTAWKISKKIVKHNLGMKNKIGRFIWATLYCIKYIMILLSIRHMRFIENWFYQIYLNKSFS